MGNVGVEEKEEIKIYKTKCSALEPHNLDRTFKESSRSIYLLIK